MRGGGADTWSAVGQRPLRTRRSTELSGHGVVAGGPQRQGFDPFWIRSDNYQRVLDIWRELTARIGLLILNQDVISNRDVVKARGNPLNHRKPR